MKCIKWSWIPMAKGPKRLIIIANVNQHEWIWDSLEVTKLTQCNAMDSLDRISLSFNCHRLKNARDVMQDELKKKIEVGQN